MRNYPVDTAEAREKALKKGLLLVPHHFYTLYDLWQMLEIAGLQIRDIVTWLESLNHHSSVLPPNATDAQYQEQKTRVIQTLIKLNRAIEQIGVDHFPITVDQVERITAALQTLVGHPIEFLHLMTETRELQNRFLDELKAKAFLMLSKGEKTVYDCKQPPFGQAVYEKFPEASFHLEEASKCYILERYVAGVFHLMCALQTPIDDLARKLELSVSVQWINWQPVIDQIQSKINALPHSTDAQKERRERYQQVLQHLSIVKDARRNPVMHGRGNCTPDVARQIRSDAEAFMQQMAGLPD